MSGTRACRGCGTALARSGLVRGAEAADSRKRPGLSGGPLRGLTLRSAVGATGCPRRRSGASRRANQLQRDVRCPLASVYLGPRPDMLSASALTESNSHPETPSRPVAR